MAERIIRATIVGSSAGAVKAFEETALASEIAGKKVAASTEAAGASMSSSLLGVIPGGQKLSGAIEALKNPYVAVATAAAAASIAVGVISVNMASKYEDATAKMAAASGISQDQAKKVGDAFLGMGGKTVFTAQSMMEAYAPISGQLAMVNGGALDAQQSLAVMSAAANLASATGSDLNTSTASLAQTLQAFHQPISAAAADTDTLFSASKAVGMPIDEFTNGLAKMHARLGDVGGSLPELSTMFVDFANHGLTGRAALGALSTATNTLLSGTPATSAAVKDLGLSVYNAQGQFVGMSSVIAQLQPKLAGMSQQQRMAAENALFGSGAFEKMDSTLMAGTAGWNQAAAAVNKQGAAQAAANKATNTLSGSMDKIKSSLSSVAIQIGERLQPVLNKLAEWFAIGAAWLADKLPGALDFLGKVFNVTFAIIGGIISGFVTAIQVAITIITPVVQVLATVFSTVAGIIANVVGVIITVVEAIVGAVQGVIDSPVFKTIVSIFQVAFTPIGAVVGAVGTAIGAIGTAIKGVADWLGKNAQIIIGVFQSVFGWVHDHIIQPVNTAFDLMLGKFDDLSKKNNLFKNIINTAQAAQSQTQEPAASGHATGGVIAPGTYGWTGEQGRELIYGGTTGVTVFPMSKVGGASIVQEFHLHGNDSDLLAKVQSLVQANNAALARAVSARAA